MSAIADQIAIYMKVEDVAYGTAATGNYQTMRLVSESFGQDSNFIESQEIVSDRQVADIIRASLSASGELAFELSYGTYDEWLEAATESAAWGSEVKETYSITFTSTTLTDSSANFVAAGYLINQWVRITGAAGAVNNTYVRLTVVATTVLTFESAASGGVVAEGPTGSVVLTQGSKIVNGTTQKSFSIEREYTDTANEFVMHLGMTISGFTLNVTPDEIMTGTFSFLGKNAASATSTAAGTPDAATTTAIMNAIDNVVAILEGGTVYGSTAFTLSVTNNLRARPEIAQSGSVSIGAGKAGVTGTLSAYFATKAVMDKYLADTASKLSLVLNDSAGNGYVIDMPQTKYTNGRRVGGGVNTDIFAEMDYSAYKDPTELLTISIQRFPV